MLRHWYVDGEFNEARLSELEALVGNIGQFPFSLVLNPAEKDLMTGYAEWSASYDGPNPLITSEEPIVRAVFDRLAGPGVSVLDAACGTGRHAAYVASLGCEATGIDQSQEMLAIARSKVPSGRFVVGDVRSMPFADGEFDAAVVSLALCHLADPTDAIVELARVLRSGGTLVIADPHPGMATNGGQAFYGGVAPGREMTWVRNHYHPFSTWMRAFRVAGLQVQGCDEVSFSADDVAGHPVGAFYPDAVRAAFEGVPILLAWTLITS